MPHLLRLRRRRHPSLQNRSARPRPFLVLLIKSQLVRRQRRRWDQRLWPQSPCQSPPGSPQCRRPNSWRLIRPLSVPPTPSRRRFSLRLRRRAHLLTDASVSQVFRARHHAMATEFEVIIAQDDVDAAYAGQVADALFAEVDRMEDELSRFKAGSDIWRINHLKAGERCPVGMATRDCLNLAKAVHQETNGAFDITIGPLMNIFRHADGESRIPDPEEEAEARKKIGMQGFEVGDDGFV